MKIFYILGLLIIFFSCTILKQSDVDSRKIDLTSVSQFKYGLSKTNEILQLFGNPDQIIALKKAELTGNENWIYSERKDGQEFERLGFLVDKKSEVVVSATWSVRIGDTVYEKNSVFSYFKNAKFESKKRGLVSQDYFSDDLIYFDSKLGLSFLVNGASKTVNSISFEAPWKN